MTSGVTSTLDPPGEPAQPPATSDTCVLHTPPARQNNTASLTGRAMLLQACTRLVLYQQWRSCTAAQEQS